MKNQYFGDINDYRKYGLLRAILQASGVRMLLAWMLTPDDGRADETIASYLQEPGKWSRFDPFLYSKLKLMSENGSERKVQLIEGTGLLPNAAYFSTPVPDTESGRGGWFEALLDAAENTDFVFLDPDKGLEVETEPCGSGQSARYLYRHEVEGLWRRGKSLLVYQHFESEDRDHFVQRMLTELREAAPGSLVEAFVTADMVFLMALQPGHLQYHKAILDTLRRKWRGEIDRHKLKSAPYARRPVATRPYFPLN